MLTWESLFQRELLFFSLLFSLSIITIFSLIIVHSFFFLLLTHKERKKREIFFFFVCYVFVSEKEAKSVNSVENYSVLSP